MDEQDFRIEILSIQVLECREETAIQRPSVKENRAHKLWFCNLFCAYFNAVIRFQRDLDLSAQPAAVWLRGLVWGDTWCHVHLKRLGSFFSSGWVIFTVFPPSSAVRWCRLKTEWVQDKQTLVHSCCCGCRVASCWTQRTVWPRKVYRNVALMKVFSHLWVFSHRITKLLAIFHKLLQCFQHGPATQALLLRYIFAGVKRVCMWRQSEI